MAGKRTLNTGNLESLGAAVLAELLMEVSGGNAVIQRRLRLALAAAEGASEAAQEVRKRLAAIARSTTFVDSRKRKALVAELEAQRQAITGPIAEADPDLAVDLLVRFLQLGDGVMDRCSDSTGAVIGVFWQAAADLGPIATAAKLGPDRLAEQVSDLLADNGYGQFDQLIPAMAEALGEQGLRRLEQDCRDRGARDGHFALLQIAECRGDVDSYLAQFSTSQLSWPNTAADVANHLLAAGRPQQALAVLDGAAKGANTWHSPEWDEARIAVLDTLGRVEEAQHMRWHGFGKTLSIPQLRDYLKRLEAFEDVEAEERAFQVAEEHSMPLLALEFLVAWPALPRAERYVIEHWQEWDGEAFEVYGPAAERLSADHPLAAVVLLRAMVVFALSMGRAKRYRYAAEHLRSCEQLSARIDHWQGIESHGSFVGRLREAFGMKWSFWQLIDRSI
ncbi:DUF6880 family protein [Synechococcus sp. CBW1107]|uniref:DUF6880 family protein n=1 Tax=Synechococcus sp. CBW1107 TaxID=2789857 RepID=UPI002AD5879D|nr:DUF6880 family protein [Synechococcus sp. CBW1107]CAK6690343.1 hypothetical protein ICNINCKA_00789 [Synechococcus sp. CBW1107]